MSQKKLRKTKDTFTKNVMAKPHPAAPILKLTGDKEQDAKLLAEHKKQRNVAKRLHKVPKTAAKPTQEFPEPKLGRNSLCPCGSKKKFKKCCLNI